MTVELLHHTPLWVAARAIRTCWNSHHKSDSGMHNQSRPEIYGEAGPKDKDLIERVGNKNKHASTLEHLVYSFAISGISRAVLQELARHRIASLSVKSTRYTLKELKDEPSFSVTEPKEGWLEAQTALGPKIYLDMERASHYIVLVGDIAVDARSVVALENVRNMLVEGASNDVAKYALPEAFKTGLVWTVNARSLQNFLKLRTSRAALREIRELANEIFESLPKEHKYLFTDFVLGHPNEIPTGDEK